MKLYCFCDASFKKDIAGIGIIIITSNKKVIHSQHYRLICNSSMDAEIGAISTIINFLLKLSCTNYDEIKIISDCMTAINGMNGSSLKIKNPNFLSIAKQKYDLLKNKYNNINLVWIKRKYNIADRLSKMIKNPDTNLRPEELESLNTIEENIVSSQNCLINTSDQYSLI